MFLKRSISPSATLKTPEVVVQVDPLSADLVETRVIDGRKCLVIPMEGEVVVNGVHINLI